MRILIVTDAWAPQINGVVRTLTRTRQELEGLGHEVRVISPDLFRNLPCPTYPEIRLAVLPGRRLPLMIDAFQPCAIHISTEGPLGQAARRYCLKRRLPFTTAYHTRFPEYIRARTKIPVSATYRLMRRFHRPASGVMVATRSMERELAGRGFRNLRHWSRGVDTELFRPRDKDLLDLPRPFHLYVGRVAVEKNIEDFLRLELAGSKLVVGDGPQLSDLRRKYPETRFVGSKVGEELAAHYAAADVFVFPSRTDTFGLVLLEALASGVPVAAYPVPGPLDIVDGTGVGVLDEDLAAAARRAIAIPPERCREVALRYSSRASAEQFVHNLQPFC
jgi:glycosyltransferase involved in cell wall biosynthesis